MKKMLLLGALSLLAFSNVQAQNTVPTSQMFGKGAVLWNFGANLPGAYLSPWGRANRATIPVHTNLEVGIHEFVGVGPSVGLTFIPFTDRGIQYYSQSLYMGVRMSVHLSGLIEELAGGDLGLDNIDLYFAATPGMRVSYVRNVDPALYPTEVRLNGGANLGLRYYLNQSLGLYVEGGFGWQGFAKAGVTVRLK